MSDSLTGREVNGYRIGPPLGAGGMGEVYQATKLEDDTSVAIKFLRRDIYPDAKLQGRFAREIRIMQELNHPHIMPIYESGIYEQTLYYTMHIVNGQTLSAYLRRNKQTPQSFYPILDQLCSALSYGHTENLVHRDLKPDNVFIERNRETASIHVYLGDFGLGKRQGIDQTLTEADAVLGTPHYMAPECVLGDALTQKADIYALGIITYEALLGKLPFDEPSGHLTAMAQVTKAAPPMTQLNPAFPALLEEIVMEAMEKDPNNRTANAEEFKQNYFNALFRLTEEERNTLYWV